MDKVVRWIQLRLDKLKGGIKETHEVRRWIQLRLDKLKGGIKRRKRSKASLNTLVPLRLPL